MTSKREAFLLNCRRLGISAERSSDLFAEVQAASLLLKAGAITPAKADTALQLASLRALSLTQRKTWS